MCQKVKQVSFETLYKKTLTIFKRIMRKVLEGGVSQVALRKAMQAAVWEGETQCEEATGGCKTCLTGTQQRTRGGCGGTRRTEECGGKRRGEREKRRCCQRIRGPLSPARRPTQRGGRGRAAWPCSQPGDARSPFASSGPEPEQGEPAQRRRELQRRADRRSMQGGREGGKGRREAVCTERLTQEISASAVKYLKQGSTLHNSDGF